MYIKTKCPECGAEMRVLVDMSSGPPDEVYGDCKACDKHPLWQFIWWYDGELGEYRGDAETVWGADRAAEKREEAAHVA